MKQTGKLGKQELEKYLDWKNVLPAKLKGQLTCLESEGITRKCYESARKLYLAYTNKNQYQN